MFSGTFSVSHSPSTFSHHVLLSMSSTAAEAYPPDLGEEGEERVAFIPTRSNRVANSDEFRLNVSEAHDLNAEGSHISDLRSRHLGTLSWRQPVEPVNESRISRIWRKLVVIYKANVGLLLIGLSQLCASCMNISVKILNGLDPPVPPFEVSNCSVGLRSNC
jgi:hypothetical protein